MTNNEAIGILAIVVETAKGRCFVTDEAISDAYAMAIKALEAQELSKNSPKLGKENGDLQPTCNNLATDTISRQAVIDAMKDMYRAAEKWLRDATDDMTKARAESCMASLVEIKLRTEKLPVVQPDHVADIGKKADGDCISRQGVIDAFHTWFRNGFEEDKWWNSTHVLAAIEGLPSVQQDCKWETCFECPLSHGCPKIKGCTNGQANEYASQIPNDCPLSAQSELIRCKDCKYMIDTGDDLMCDNAKGWVVATTSDFGCVLAERRTDDKTNKGSSC